MGGMGGVGVGVWDIKGKSMNAPLYQLLGGRSREAVLVYGHASGTDLEKTLGSFGHFVSLGYKAIRAQSGIPGLSSTYGLSHGAMAYEPAEKDAPPENQWSTEHYMRFVPQLFAALRKELGTEITMLHVAHHRLTPIEAGRARKDLEPYRLL